MRIKMDVWLDVDKLTGERLLNSTPAARWKSIVLLSNTRPDAVSFSDPVIHEEEGAEDAKTTPS